MCPNSGYRISSEWLQQVRRDVGKLGILNERSSKITWQVDNLYTAVVLKVKMCPNSRYRISVHRFQSCTMKALVWLHLVRRDVDKLDIMNETSTIISWNVDYLFTVVLLKVKMCPNSGYRISVHRFQSCTIKAFVWLHLVRRVVGKLDIMNERSTKISWKVDYLFTAVVLKVKMCPNSRYRISVHRIQSCTMKESVWLQLVRPDFGMLDLLNENSSRFPCKVDYLFEARVLKVKMCPNSGYWVSVHRFQSCTIKASVWLQLVRRDVGKLDILNERSSKISWQVNNLFTAVVLKVKMCPNSRYRISVHRFQSCTMKALVWLHLVRRDVDKLDIMNETSTIISWNVDYLFTAVLLKVKMCPNSGYRISVHRFQSCTIKAFVWLHLVRRVVGKVDIMNERSTKISWKADYLFTAVVLKVKMCPNSGYRISVHRFQSCTMKASVWLHLVRRDVGKLDILNERSTKISWKIDYLFTAVVLKMKMCPNSGYWVPVHRFQSCTMVWLQLVRRDVGKLDILNERSTKISWKVDNIFTAVVLKVRCAPIVDTEFLYIDSSLAQWKHRNDFSRFAVTSVSWEYWMKEALKSLDK